LLHTPSAIARWPVAPWCVRALGAHVMCSIRARPRPSSASVHSGQPGFPSSLRNFHTNKPSSILGPNLSSACSACFRWPSKQCETWPTAPTTEIRIWRRAFQENLEAGLHGDCCGRTGRLGEVREHQPGPPSTLQSVVMLRPSQTARAQARPRSATTISPSRSASVQNQNTL
jgi:hypothetical protein